MKWYRSMAIPGAIMAASAVILQAVLMLENRVTGIAETVVRFFSFFTILTNLLVAVYFTAVGFFRGSRAGRFFTRFDHSTAITVYIVIVRAVYQVLLRHIWEPTGLQQVVDELLHTIIPVYVVIYWIALVPERISWRRILPWLWYPVVYFAWIMIRGAISGFYPYPFIHAVGIGWAAALQNAVLILGMFALVAALFIGIARLRTGTKAVAGA